MNIPEGGAQMPITSFNATSLRRRSIWQVFCIVGTAHFDQLVT